MATTQTQPSLDEILRMADEGSRKLNEKETVEQEISFDTFRKSLIKKLQETTTQENAMLADNEAREIVDNFLESKYDHQMPLSSGISAIAARAYVNRQKIAKRTTIGAIALASVLGLYVAVTKTVDHMQERARNSEVLSVRELLASENAKLDGIYRQATQLPSIIQSQNLVDVERDMATSELAIAQTEAIEGKSALTPYVVEEISYQELNHARKAVAAADQHAVNAAAHISKVSALIDTQKKLVALESALTSNYQAIQKMELSQRAKERATIPYESGVGAYKARDLTTLTKSTSELNQLRIGFSSLRQDYTTIMTVAAHIDQIAKEDVIRENVATAKSNADAYLSNADFEQIKRLKASTQSLEEKVDSQYTLRIVSRQGVKSGIDRYYTDSSGKRSAGYYIIVEAIDASGNTKPVEITNMESGEVRTVNIWGELVPQAIYEKVKSDKMDNGIVDNNVFAQKKRGYLSIQMEFPTERKGQITRW